jgi:hypothetical protein
MTKDEAESYIGKTVYTVFEGVVKKYPIDAAKQSKHRSRAEDERPWFIASEQTPIGYRGPIITDEDEATNIALTQLAANIDYERGQIDEAQASIDRYEAQAKKLRVLRDLRAKR